MILIHNLTEADKGREVAYTVYNGEYEVGRVTGWNEQHHLVFVHYHTRYKKNGDIVGPTNDTISKATPPEILHWL